MFRKKQKEEALRRMKALDLHENAIKEFKEEGKLNKSESIGFLYYLNDEEEEMIREWEKETGNLAYHARLDYTKFGTLMSIFYISKYEEEWEMDMDDLENNMALVYVMNLEDDMMSEFGSIVFKKNIGGLIRRG